MRTFSPSSFASTTKRPSVRIGKGGERRSRQLAPLSLAQSSLQAEVFGGTEEIGIGEELTRLSELMAQLRPISRQVVEPGQDQETDQARVHDSCGDRWRC